jgi:hypothetical protein
MNKFYVVPAEVIESNFPDDLDKLMESCTIIETEKNITEVAEALLNADL